MRGCFCEQFQHQYSLDILCLTWLHTDHLWLVSTASVIFEMALCLTLLGIFLYWFVSFSTFCIMCELSVVSIVFIHHHTMQIMAGLCTLCKFSQLGCFIAWSWTQSAVCFESWNYYCTLLAILHNCKILQSLLALLIENFMLVPKMFTACDKTQQCCILTCLTIFLASRTQVRSVNNGMAVAWIMACPFA